MNRTNYIFSIIAIAVILLATACQPTTQGDQVPNILLILADDMGYSDLGCYGGEIQTPNLDALAKGGIRFTQFYNAGRCCPTRASLLTGKYAHEVGMGWMTAADLGQPGYVGDLSKDVATVAELLEKKNYKSYLSGKWHLTSYDKLSKKDSLIKDSWPLQRGFNQFYGLLKGSGDYFNPDYLAYNNELIDPPGDYYITDAISDSASSMIGRHIDQTQDPFFLYLAYTAPHFPLHAKPRDIEKYMSYYEKGWDSLRSGRLTKMKELRINIPFTDSMLRDERVVPWIALEDSLKKDMIKRMVIYAAQIDVMDQGIGRVIQTLKEKGALDNTLIVFLSDNGATDEKISRKDRSYEALGTGRSFEAYRRPWANLGNTPFREYKKFMHEGGISTPLIMHWPKRIKEGKLIHEQVGHLIDLVPTFLEVAGEKWVDFEGQSLVPLMDGETFDHEPIFWEHEANRAVRKGNWKLVSFASGKPPYEGPWELYDLSKDRGESNDLARKYPAKVAELSSLWADWAQSHQVLPLDGRGWSARKTKN